jgi:hypothetical protein
VKEFSLHPVSLTHLALLEEVQHSLDNKYSRLLTHARDEWEHRFAGNDPSDDCVSVYIAPSPEASAPPSVGGSTLVKATQRGERPAAIYLSQFAQ